MIFFFKAQHWMHFLLPDLSKHLWLKFPDIIFLEGQCGGEESCGSCIGQTIVLQLLGMIWDGFSLR